MYYVYVIENQDKGGIYIGYTSDLTKRLQRHNGERGQKKSSYTYKNKGIWKIIYKEEYENASVARVREKQLKTAKGRKFLKQFRM